MRTASAPPPRLPGDVRKSIRSTKERADWRMITKTWRALIAISEAARARPEDAGLVDELELGGDRALGEVAGDVRQADPDEADALAGELAGRGDDHHLGRREAVPALARSRARPGAHR